MKTLRNFVFSLAIVLSAIAPSCPRVAFAQSPQTQAIAARQVVINDVVNWVTYANARNASTYAEAVRQWISNKQQGGLPYPIPVPLAAWQIAPHKYTDQEKAYDARYPGIPPLVDDVQNGPPVAPQYVEPATPPPATSCAAIGVQLYGQYFQALAADTCADGYTVTKDGHTFQKRAYIFGNGWWIQTN